MRTRSQRLLSMVLALSMLLTFLPVSAFADDTPPPYAISNEDAQTLDENNTCTDNGNTYTYELNTANNTATLTKFTGTDADVPKEVTKGTETYKVTAIGENAFATMDSGKHIDNKTLQSVKLPDTITDIGDQAFAHCVKILSIEIPDSVTEIKTGTFGGCSLLGSVKLPINLTTIGMGAFAECPDLESIELPDGLMNVEEGAFSGANLGTIDWPVSLTSVGTGAFQNQIDYTSFPPSIKVSINIIIYHGTQAQWDEMANDQNFASTNFQLVAKDVDLRCAHTVTFNKNGHGDPEEKVVQYDEKAKKPDDPKADGFTFKGWYTAPDGDETFDFNTGITKDETAYAHWEVKKTDPTPENPGNTDKPDQTTPPESTDKPTDKPDDNKTDTDKPNKPNEPTPPEAPAVEEDDTAAIGYAAAAVTAAFVGWGAYRIGSEVYLKYLLPKDVLLPQNRLQLAELLWEDAGRPAPADAAPYADVDANDTDARQAARWAVENGLLTLPDAEKPEEFAPYRSVSYAKSARAWNKAQQLKENAAR